MSGETILNGRYALVAQQGSGGMSVIYKAIDRALGRTVAVKILRPSLTTDPAFLDKFRMEARSVANLSHPNIVTVYDVGSDGPTHYIVMEMVEGTDLKKIIKAEGKLPLDRVLGLAIQICAGIGYAHRSGLVHADVKPQNILVTNQDTVKVTDFGIAQALTDTQPQRRADVVWGSPHYFAPEQAKGEPPSPASDVYSIGIVLFEMLSGQLPYAGANQQELAMAHIRDSIPMVTKFNPAVPESLARIIFKVMSKEASGRYREADQLGNVLQSFKNRSRDRTAINPQVPSSEASHKPHIPQPPHPHTPRNRPPGIGIPPTSSESVDVTAKYSAAPNAPQPYDPRRPYPSEAQEPPAHSNPIKSQPQPFEQRYTPPPPQPVPHPQPPQIQSSYQSGIGDSDYFRAQASQPLQVNDGDNGIDYVTIILAILAFIAVAGLVPLWIVVFVSR